MRRIHVLGLIIGACGLACVSVHGLETGEQSTSDSKIIGWKTIVGLIVTFGTPIGYAISAGELKLKIFFHDEFN
jgi:drug/metabolite transporter (DMT)-like permease